MYNPEPKQKVVAASKADVFDRDSPVTGQRISTDLPIFGQIEDLLLGVLRPALEPHGVTVLDQHNKDIDTPLVLVRSSRAGGNNGFYPDDVRFMRSARVAVSVIMNGPEADVRAAQLIEAVQHIIMQAWRNQTVIPGAGSIADIRAWVEPVRVSDFQTATNIVQYASLPRGAARYEQNFNIVFRPDMRVNPNPFLAGKYQKEG